MHSSVNKRNNSIDDEWSNGMTEWPGFYITVCIYQNRIIKLLVLEEVWEDDLGPSLYCNNERTQARKSQAPFSDVTGRQSSSPRPELLFLGSSLLRWLTEVMYNEEPSKCMHEGDIQRMAHSSLPEIHHRTLLSSFAYQMWSCPTCHLPMGKRTPWDPQKTNLSTTTQLDSGIGQPGTWSFWFRVSCSCSHCLSFRMKRE